MSGGPPDFGQGRPVALPAAMVVRANNDPTRLHFASTFVRCNPLNRLASGKPSKVLSSVPNGRSGVDLGPSLERSRTAGLRRFRTLA
jgi:hypothetical protein